MTILSKAGPFSSFPRAIVLASPSTRAFGVFFARYPLKLGNPSNKIQRDSVWQSKQIRELKYNNFGHKRDPMPGFSVFWHFLLGAGVFGCFFWDTPMELAKAIWAKLNPTPKAASIEESCENQDKDAAPTISKKGFNSKVVADYENRIRQYSTPDKVFRYFASLQVIHADGSTQIYMTPEDFLRSITPGMTQPTGLGLDHFRRVDEREIDKVLVEDLKLPEDSVFLKISASGLISFADYIFLLTVLSTSKRHFEIAFRMFDINGDGSVDREEFEQVAKFLCQNSSHGNRHRDVSKHSRKSVNSALSRYFFGTNGDEKLTVKKFLEFHEKLQNEIISLEFERRTLQTEGKLSELAFTEILLAYAGYSRQRIIKIKKTVRKEYGGLDDGDGISLSDYLSFFRFLNNIADVDTALTFYHLAGASIDKTIFKHVARSVANVELDDHIIDVIFTIFDENQDGQLSNREFVAVMKERALRGLEKPKDTGFVKFLESAVKCASSPRMLFS